MANRFGLRRVWRLIGLELGALAIVVGMYGVSWADAPKKKRPGPQERFKGVSSYAKKKAEGDGDDSTALWLGIGIGVLVLALVIGALSRKLRGSGKKSS